MGVKHIIIFKIDTLTLSQNPINKEFYLWDDTRKMNISMHEKTEQETFIYALKYYQKRLLKLESDYKSLYGKVEYFVNEVTKDLEF